jgi:type IV pilus assembly protein PilE
MSAKKGFTLLELMITISIIGILAVIAIPSYQGYMLRSHRANGLATMQANMLAIEQFRTRTGALPTAAAQVAGYLGASNGGGRYVIGFTANNANLITLTMNPNTAIFAGFTDPSCNTVTLNSNGVQGATSNWCWANSQ